MLEGISPIIGPELLATLCRMGHGDEIVLADAHFPGHSLHAHVLRTDGVAIPSLLDGILPLFPLDTHDRRPLVMMDAVAGDVLDPAVEIGYSEIVQRHRPGAPPIARLDRFAFYERARATFAIVVTGDATPYGNILLKKGLVRP
jgi:L-fucose mutarotase